MCIRDRCLLPCVSRSRVGENRAQARAGMCHVFADRPASASATVAMAAAAEAGGSDDAMLDLVVIGAGPHALSLLCRLIDSAPDLLTEQERTHLVQKAGTRARSHKEVRKGLARRFDGPRTLPNVAVVDAHLSLIHI